MNPTVALPGSMTWMGIRLSSGSRRPQSLKGLPLHLLNRFSVATVRSRRMAGNALRLVISISASADFARSVAQRLRIPRIAAWSRASARKLFVEILGDLPEQWATVCRDGKASPCRGGVFRRGFAATRFRTMELITILNRCHHFRDLRQAAATKEAGSE